MNVRNRTDPRFALWLCSNDSGRILDPSRDLMALDIFGRVMLGQFLRLWICSRDVSCCRLLHREAVLHPGIKRPTHAISVAILRATTTRAVRGLEGRRCPSPPDATSDV